MDIRKLQRAIVDGLEDTKAQNILVFNTEHLSPLFERVIIASGTSNRQTKALAASVRDAVKSRGMQVLRTEGEDNGEWIIVDCGAAVAHIMQPAIRDYYHLEEIWGDKPVKLKLGGDGKAGLPKAERTDDDEDEDDAPAPAAKKAPARKAAAKKTAAAKAPAKKAPAKKAAAKKAPARKTAAAGRGAITRSEGQLGGPTKTTTIVVGAPRKAAAKKAPARKAAAKKTGAASRGR
ncbi:ribosome silencing factor [Aquabacterium sp. J223]|uniref:ribosome silencing factor n=1 Tax=Aquabacterium sp. J223 TaxID=2898431 RepID=UPI0021AE0090|nr:ribosome silencing factor [Aquabacterium sp. J223]UUX94694.1 ribosome silencing factor [Aquabacterium sp. J223]